MCTTRPFVSDDLFRFNNINMDARLTETYNLSFYLGYAAKEPELFRVQEAHGGRLQGYLMGKCEGDDELWHGHVTAVTVAPEYRRLGAAKALMKHLEDVSTERDCYFVDLFVRPSNSLAVQMYKSFEFVVYRTIIRYYTGGASGDEDAFDMRKALAKDVDKKSIVPLTKPIHPHELEFY